VDVGTEWQNGAPAPGATVQFIDTDDELMEEFETDENGLYSLDIIEVTMFEDENVTHNDYTVSGELNSMFGTETATVDADKLGQDAIIITIDDDGLPTVNITSPADGLITNDGKFTMNGTASDIGSGMSIVEVNDGTGWTTAIGMAIWEYEWDLAEGEYTLEARTTDIAGNQVTDSITVIVDMTMPDITITEPTGLYVNTSIFDLVGTTEEDAMLKVDGTDATVDVDGSFSFELDLADGEHNITVEAEDLAGNMNTVYKEVIVDTVAPEVTSDVADGEYVGTASFTLTGTTDADTLTVNGNDATIDMDEGTWTIDLPLDEGTNTISIEAADLAGNTAGLGIDILLDLTPPEIDVTSPSTTDTITTNKDNLTLEGTVTGADTLEFNDASLSFDGTGAFTKEVTLTEGDNVLTLTAEDLAGNMATWTMTVVLDTKAPEVEIESPDDGSATGSSTITVKGEVDDVDADLMHGNNSVTNDNGTFSTTMTLSPGENTITIEATDIAGNTGSATITVTFDDEVVLTVTSPTKPKKTVSKDTYMIEGTSEAGASILINDVEIPVNPDGSFSYELVLMDGKNEVVVKAVDAAGNVDTDSYTITREVEESSGLDMMMTLLLGIIFLVVGLVVGLVAGKAMSKPKGPAPGQYEPEQPPVEERPFEPAEEEPLPEPEPEPATEPPPAPPEEAKPVPAKEPEPKPEPAKEPGPKPLPPPPPPPKSNGGSTSLNDLIQDIDKKAK
jgi:hypothetical protein